MKTKAMIIASMLFTLTVGAQTVNVHLKSGEVVKYDSSVFDYIDFSATETETPVGYTECPDANHPHMIDLGLPSGTLWRCCNEGASTPEAYGDYYTFGQVSTAPTREQIKELVENCTYQWTTVNGVNGGKFTGPNGGSIFLPAAGSRWRGEFYIRGLLGPLLVLDSLRRDTAPTDWASTRASRTGTTAAATSSNPCAQCVRTESASFRERE